MKETSTVKLQRELQKYANRKKEVLPQRVFLKALIGKDIQKDFKKIYEFGLGGCFSDACFWRSLRSFFQEPSLGTVPTETWERSQHGSRNDIFSWTLRPVQPWRIPQRIAKNALIFRDESEIEWQHYGKKHVPLNFVAIFQHRQVN